MMIRIFNGRKKKEGESTVALINIVFLMLVFFLIAGTIVPPIDNQVNPILSEVTDTADLENTLAVRTDGSTLFQGKETTPELFVTEILRDVENAGKSVRILADKDLQAIKLVKIVNQLQAAGAQSVRIITERKDL